MTRTMTDNHQITVYIKKIENSIKFKSKSGYYLELLTPELMKSLKTTENKITKHKNGGNELHLKITGAILAYCNIVNNDY